MYTPTYAETLQLIARLPERRPYTALPDRLAPLFRRLAGVTTTAEAAFTEDFIWSLWMSHPNAAAERVLDLATSDIAARRFDIADTRLTRLLRTCPDFAEAWNKRATLYYLLGRDEECIADIRRALALEPRHFGALAEFGEICLAHGDTEAALFGFRAALRVNPHMEGVARNCRNILDGKPC